MTEIALNNVRINFGFKKVLQGVSFEISSGEKVAIVGNNGSGKTTIFRIIAGTEICDEGLVTIRKDAVLGYLEQDSNIAEDDITVIDYLKDAQKAIFDVEKRMREVEACMSSEQTGNRLDKLLSEYDRLQNQFTAMSGYETEESFGKICTAFQIDDDMLSRKCKNLSGGQKTIVKMAKILLQKPDILLLDEPTNHIDIAALQWLEGFIKDYRGTVVIISHDRYFMDKTVTKTILLDKGQTEIFHGNYSFCLEEQDRLMMKEFEKYKNQQKMITEMKAAIKRFREWGAIGDNKRLFRKANNMEKQLEKLELIDKPKLERDKLPMNFETGKRSGKRVMVLKELGFAYADNLIFDGAELEVFFRDRICLMGNNGSGKTTLIKLILGELQTRGSIILGESVRIGYIEQEIMFEKEGITILEAFKTDACVHEQEARRILAKYFICGDEVYKRLESLSGGERVILKLAMLMQKQVNFLILDEPTNHLDIDTKELLEESLLNYKGTILFISHDRYHINKVATGVAYVEDKKIKRGESKTDYFS